MESKAGLLAGRWSVVFLMACALFPIYTQGLRNLAAGLLGDLATLLFAVALGIWLTRIDRLSAVIFALVSGWLGYATLVVAIQAGYLVITVTD